MKLNSIRVEKHDMKLKAPWAIAGHVHESVENIFIEITDENGVVMCVENTTQPLRIAIPMMIHRENRFVSELNTDARTSCHDFRKN